MVSQLMRALTTEFIYLFHALQRHALQLLRAFRPPNIAGDDYEHAAKPYPA